MRQTFGTGSGQFSGNKTQPIQTHRHGSGIDESLPMGETESMIPMDTDTIQEYDTRLNDF